MFQNRKIDWKQPAGQKQEIYVCSICSEPLFDTAHKFDSKTGFPSFWGHLQDNVTQKPFSTYGRERTQLVCHKCGQHLGHLFDDARTPSQVRYCINADSIQVQEENDGSSE